MKRFAIPAACFALILCFALAATGARAAFFDPAPMLEQAEKLLDEGRFLESVDLYHEVSEQASDPATKALGLVRAADVMGIFLDMKEQALAFYKQATGLATSLAPGNPVLANAYFNGGMLAYELGDAGTSRAMFSRFLDLYPNDPRSFTASYMVERIAEEGAAARPEGVGEPSAPLGEMPVVRVALGKEKSLEIDLPRGGKVTGSSGTLALSPGNHRLGLSGGNVSVDGRSLGRTARLSTASGFRFKGKAYDGDALLSSDSGKVLLVESLPMETYLRGVVPREMSASWPLEALKAQAVAARSYAARLIEKSQDKPYDVSATTASQVYGGADAYAAESDKAVVQTRGQVLESGDAPILAYFHAHSGGTLEDDALVWTADLPYYAVTPDDISMEIKPLTWSAEYSAGELARALKEHGFSVKRVYGVKTESSSPSGRMVKVRLETDAGPVTVKSNSLRIWLGATRMKSTLGSFAKRGDSYLVQGKGYGHGVGMSQWGAYGMAKKGSNYLDILAHYYPGVPVKLLY